MTTTRIIGRPRPQGPGPMLRPLDVFHDQGEVVKAELQGLREPFFDWAMRLPEPKAGTLDFSRFPFQRELYEEGTADAELVIKKSTQVGISALLLRWTLYWADVRGGTGLYVFPALKQMYDFSDARIRTVIDASRYLRERIPPQSVQNKGLKKVGNGLVYFRGSESKVDLDSVDADHLALDEYDTLVAKNIPDAERRVGASQLGGMIRRVGVPSYPGTGIADLYAKTDRRQWHVRCGSCRDWQPIDFWANVDQEAVRIVCRRCTEPLDVANGEWVPEFPERSVRGYHVSRLLAPQANLKEIIAASKKRTPYERQVFHNKDLGLEWAAKEGRLTDEALAAAQSRGEGYTTVGAYAGDGLVTMGVDVASARALNVRISLHREDGTKIALKIALADTFDEVAQWMDQYNVAMCAVDHLPEGRLARGFAERFAGRVYLVAYNTSQSPTGDRVIDIKDEERFITVRRVEVIDATFHLINTQRNVLPADWPDDYPAHLKALMKVAERDEVGRQTVTYRATNPDDYAQAEIYDVVATEAFWVRQEVEAATSDEYTVLDERLEFERTQLADHEATPEYHEGPSDDFAY